MAHGQENKATRQQGSKANRQKKKSQQQDGPIVRKEKTSPNTSLQNADSTVYGATEQLSVLHSAKRSGGWLE